MDSFPRPAWHLVVPVKRAELAKSRLQPPHPLQRPELAAAVAADTLEVVCRALPPEQVRVVTRDPSARRLGQQLGAVVLPDPGSGLNDAVRAGLAGLDPDDTARAVLLGDLPALREQDLAAALASCAGHQRAVVPDAAGTGTVLLTARPGAPLEPRFGPGSAARHALGAARLDLDLPHLRQDVDDLADLAAAARLGVGPRTAALLATEQLAPGAAAGP